MRVLQLGKYYYPFMGGIESHLEVLCRGLKEVVEVEAIVFNTERQSTQEEVDGVQVTRCGELVRLASNSISLAMISEISRRDFDVLHLHVPNPIAAAAYLAARKPKGHRLVITHHSDIVRQTKMKPIVLPLMRIAMRRAAAIVATSPEYLESSAELRPYRSKCQVIPYGIDLARLEPNTQAVAIAEEFRQKIRGPIILGIGRLIYYKGFEFAIRAMTEISATLVLVGDGPLRRPLEALTNQLGLAEKVHFAGAVHNHALLPYLLASDIFVLPSIARSEAFGIVQLEAMACGVPVVNTELDSGVRYASRHLETGLTVPPADSRALASAFQRLLDREGERKRFGIAARLRVEGKFSAMLMTRRHLQLYESLLGQSAAQVA